MNISCAQVLEFHSIFGHPIRSLLTPSVEVPEKWLRFELLKEEIEEFLEAAKTVDMVEMADALGDIIYVAYGAALTFGLDLDDPRYFTVDDDFLRLQETSQNLLIECAEHDLDYVGIHLRPAFINNDIRSIEVALVGIVKSAEGAARQLGIPLIDVVTAIHKSNLTKLGADGKPIYREDGKVIKGPNYKAPTADIMALLGV